MNNCGGLNPSDGGEEDDYMFPECYIGLEDIDKLLESIKIAGLLRGFSLLKGISTTKV